MEETVNYEDLFTVRSSTQSIYYDTIAEKQKLPVIKKRKTRELTEKRELL